MAKAAQPALFNAGELAETPSKTLTDALALWNEFAEKNKWKVARVLDQARRTALTRAVKDYGGLVGFRAALASVERNRFVMGKVEPRDGHKQFVANLDWFIRPVTVRKVLEDFYEDDGGQAGHQSLTKAMAPSDEWGRWFRDYKPRGFWPTSLGPRPEDRGCRAPPAMIEAWRVRHGVKPPPEPESREVKMQGMIASYRRVGMFDRANAIEEELARAEGRPAVLVPAPDARNPDVVPPPIVRAPPSSTAPGPIKMQRVTDVEPDYDGEPLGQDEWEEA